MCKCTPAIKTPFCGRPGCEMPAQASVIRKREDIVDRLMNLHAQATVERSHFYVGNLCTEAAREITLMREFMRKMQSAIEAEGYAIIVGVDSGFVELADRNESADS